MKRVQRAVVVYTKLILVDRQNTNYILNFTIRKMKAIAHLPFTVKAADFYVEKILQKELSEKLTFHNIIHTRNVTAAVNELCYYENIDEIDQELVLLAAVFHDTGYTKKYLGHEEESCKIAENYLRGMRRSTDEIRAIINCIEATKIPQLPINKLSQILCDADMQHLAATDYLQQAERLRNEWKAIKNQHPSDIEWYQDNIEFLDSHRYFTSYGQVFWEVQKETNISSLLELL